MSGSLIEGARRVGGGEGSSTLCLLSTPSAGACVCARVGVCFGEPAAITDKEWSAPFS